MVKNWFKSYGSAALVVVGWTAFVLGMSTFIENPAIVALLMAIARVLP